MIFANTYKLKKNRQLIQSKFKIFNLSLFIDFRKEYITINYRFLIIFPVNLLSNK